MVHSAVAEYLGGMCKDLRLRFNLLFAFFFPKEENEILGHVYPHITKLLRN